MGNNSLTLASVFAEAAPRIENPAEPLILKPFVCLIMLSERKPRPMLSIDPSTNGTLIVLLRLEDRTSVVKSWVASIELLRRCNAVAPDLR